MLKAASVNVPDIEIVHADGLDVLLGLLELGDIDAYVSETAMALPTLQDASGVHITLVFGEEQHFGFAVRNGSSLKEQLDKHLLRLKQSGIYYRLLEQFFGSEAALVVKTVWVSQVLSQPVGRRWGFGPGPRRQRDLISRGSFLH